MTSLPWWKTAVFYQIYPRSFADTTGNGVGDLAGVTSKLDYLAGLGVDALWLSPFYRSPMADFGYDVSDHCAVDPVFGDLDDFDTLLSSAHERGIRVILDFVPNHVSSEHPWFKDAISSIDSPKRDWFTWRDPAPDGGPPNNWRSAFLSKPAWTLDETSGQYYLHLFLAEQPDLEWNNPAVVSAMHDVLRFWLDRGVDGFRADVVQCIGKDPSLPDMVEEFEVLPALLQDFGPGTHEQLRAMRTLLDSYPGDRMVVGETSFLDTPRMATYLGDDDELNLAFNFNNIYCHWDAATWRNEIESTYRAVDSVGGWPTWVMSNHDITRHRTRYGSLERARAAAVMLLTLKGTPFVYMGDELGLENSEIPDEAVVDPDGRDGCRTPIPWTSEEGSGWGANSWLPVPAGSDEVSVETQLGDSGSMLELYRSLLDLRRSIRALNEGDIELLDSPPGVIRWKRVSTGSDADTSDAPKVVEVAVNFTSDQIDGAISPGRVLGSSLANGPSERSTSTGSSSLGPDEARIVVPD